MSGHTVDLDRLFDLMGAICDDDAFPHDFVELDSIVRVDQEARGWYRGYCQLHGTLRVELRADRATHAICEQIGIRSTVAGSTKSGVVAINAAVLPTPAFPANTWHSTLGFFSSGWPVAYLIATVIFTTGLLVAAFTHVSRYEEVADISPPAAAGHQCESRPKAEIVGQITGMRDCKWAESEKSPVEGNVVLGRRLALTRGLVELTYNTGAKVILQGPVSFDVESKNGGFLPVGKLTGKVELATAKGFVVRTPTATVTDLGTEFGVEVSQDGITETEVFVGEVKVASMGAEVGVREGARVLRAGQVARVEGRHIQLVPADHRDAGNKRFVRTMSVLNSARASDADAYADLVLSMRPVVYYRMERPADEKVRNTILDSGPGKYHGILRLADEYGGDPWRSGRFGNALSFRGPDAGDCVFVPDYPKATDDQLTLSAWVWASGSPRMWAVIAANWGHTLPPRGQFHFGLEREGDLAVGICCRDGQPLLVREGPSRPLPLWQWQHVAFVVDKLVVRLYRNGVEVASRPCNGIRPDHNLPVLVIGHRSDDIGDNRAKPPLNWHGRIDELAIFNRA